MNTGKMNILETENLYFLGPEGTYAWQAMQKFVKQLNIKASNIIPKKPITEILQTIDKDKNAIAVLPIENSIEGIVRETIDNLIILQDKKIQIIAETFIPISHCLLSKGKDISKIKYIVSYTQALGQCSGYICDNLKNVEIIQSSSTSEAAKMLKDKDETYAAIASETAGKIYELNILKKGINDVKDNRTRFIVLARQETKSTGNDKTSLFFSVKHEPGSLHKILGIFRKHDINLLSIESRPSRIQIGEYNFCTDIDGHKSDNNIQKALIEIEQTSQKLIIIGSYPNSNEICNKL